MKKKFLLLLIAFAAMAGSAKAALTIPWEEHFDSSPTFGTEEDQWSRQCQDGYSTSASWFWQQYQGQIRVRSNSNLNRTLIFPQMNFVANEWYYVEFNLANNLFDSELTINLCQFSGLDHSTELSKIATFKMVNRENGTMGAYFKADPNLKRVALQVINPTYGSSYIYFDDLLIKKINPAIPAGVTDMQVTSAEPGLKAATLSFKAPTTTIEGNTLNSLAEINVYADGALIETIENVSPGQALSIDLNPTVCKTVYFQIVPVNNVGAGEKKTLKADVGGTMVDVTQTSDTRNDISSHHTVLATLNADGNIAVKWDARSSGAESYEIWAMPANVKLADGLTECNYIDTSAKPTTAYARWYQIKWVDASGNVSNYATSNIFSAHNTLPYSYSALDSKQANQATGYVLTGNYSSNFWQCGPNWRKALGVTARNHMAIMPGITMKAGQWYRIDVGTGVYSSPAYMDVTFGKDNTPESQTTKVIEKVLVKTEIPEDFTDSQTQKFSTFIQVPEDGEWFPAVRFYTDDADTGSSASGSTVWMTNFKVIEVGDDIPAAIDSYNVRFHTDDATKGTIEFTAPAKNINDGDLQSIDKIVVLQDGLPYTILRNVGPGEQGSFEIEVSQSHEYLYSVYAVNSSGDGTVLDIPVIIINPAYSNDFNNKNAFSGWTVINDKMDFYTWGLQADAARCFDNRGVNNDWLITPPMHLEAGKYYKTSFTTWGTNAWYANEISLHLGQQPTVDSMTTEVIAPYTIIGEFSRDAALLKDYFTVDTTGEYYLGLHAFSAANGDEIYVDNFNVSDPIDGGVPYKADVEIKPDWNGALKGEILITAPTTQINGEPLENDPTAVRVYFDGVLIRDFGACKPGDKFTQSVEGMTQGVHLVTVICENAKGVGREYEGVAYFGINRPAPVRDVVARETSDYGVVSIEWEKNDVDYDGFPQNQDLVTYDVFRYIPDNEEQPETLLASGLTGTSLTIRMQGRGDKQDFMRFGVRARTVTAGSPGFLAKWVSVGMPELAPFKESFANYNPDMRFMMEVTGDGSPAAWGYSPYLGGDLVIEPVDNDNGIAVMEVMFLEAGARLFSGKIDLKNLKRPGLSLWVYNFADDPSISANTLALEAREVGTKEWTQIRKESIASYSANTRGWIKVQADLSEFAGKVIQLGFNGTCYRHIYTVMDCIGVDEYAADNLVMLDFEAPEFVAPGRAFSVTATTMNIGDNEAEEYDVQLYRDGKLIATKSCAALPVKGKARVRFTDTLNASEPGEHTYEARVAYNLDGDATDDGRSYTLTANESKFATVVNLQASLSAPGEVALTWQAPELPTEPVTVEEDFESFEPWTNMDDVMGDWKMYDVDGGNLNTITKNGASILPAKVGPWTQQAFFVFDSTTEDFIDNSYYQPHSGGQCLMALSNYPATTPTNDWLVSPVLSGKEQTISFWARSISPDYPENFRVYTNTEMELTKPDTFTLLATQENISDEWTKYEFTLPAGTQHFAIEHNSVGGFVFFLDDITYEAGGDERLTPRGFNVYRDDVLVAPASRMLSFVDQNVPDGDHKYGVSVAYDLGESPISYATIASSEVDGVYAGQNRVFGGKGVINIAGDYTRLDIYDTAGAHLYTLTGEKSVPMAAGIYVVTMDGETFKVTVK